MSNYKQGTADVLVKDGAGKLLGIHFSAASTTPTMIVYDNVSAAAPVIAGSFIPVAGTTYLNFPNGITFTRGLYLDIGGTVDFTCIYE